MITPTEQQDTTATVAGMQSKNVPPKIYYDGTCFYERYTEHGIEKTLRKLVTITADCISIGCLSIDPKAAKKIMKTWEEHYGPRKEEKIIL